MKYIGKKEEGKDYKERRTAYALVFNDKHEIAVIIEHGEIYNMIGGKIEDGEDVVDKMYFEYHRYFIEKYLNREKFL